MDVLMCEPNERKVMVDKPCEPWKKVMMRRLLGFASTGWKDEFWSVACRGANVPSPFAHAYIPKERKHLGR